MLEHPAIARRKQAAEAERRSRGRSRHRTALRTSSGRQSSLIAVALVAGVYLAALAAIAPLMLSAPSTFKGPAVATFR